MSSDIELGDRVQDQITEFRGVVTGTCQYISGCDQVLIVPPAVNGEFKEGVWFDTDRCTILDKGAFKKTEVSSEARPGPDKPPARRI